MITQNVEGSQVYLNLLSPNECCRFSKKNCAPCTITSLLKHLYYHYPLIPQAIFHFFCFYSLFFRFFTSLIFFSSFFLFSLIFLLQLTILLNLPFPKFFYLFHFFLLFLYSIFLSPLIFSLQLPQHILLLFLSFIFKVQWNIDFLPLERPDHRSIGHYKKKTTLISQESPK